MIHILLCGGAGTRLWPLSRELHPKQFLTLFDHQSLFQKNFIGNKSLATQSIIVCSKDHQYLAKNQLTGLDDQNIQFLLEPVGKNTTAAIALALQAVPSDAIVLVTPSDHLIEYNEDYLRAIDRAQKLAADGYIVVFGISPSNAETGYGYIESVDENVIQFHEKPDLETAFRYLSKPHFYWNSGMICFRAETLLNAMKRHSPEILTLSETAFKNASVDMTNKTISIAEADMVNIPSISIDYALLEKMKGLKMISSHFRWSDLGNFDSFYSQLKKDEFGNALHTQSFCGINAKNNLIMGDRRVIAAVDVEDLIVVDTQDALLIAKSGNSQKIREVITKLKISGSNIHKESPVVLRPWGNFSILDSAEKYKVKKITVKPGLRLSLQTHTHRHEHWVIIDGSAQITIGDQVLRMEPNQAAFIPMGEVHRIENVGDKDLIFIEIQYGSYLEEDDLVRIEDDFARLN